MQSKDASSIKIIVMILGIGNWKQDVAGPYLGCFSFFCGLLLLALATFRATGVEILSSKPNHTSLETTFVLHVSEFSLISG